MAGGRRKTGSAANAGDHEQRFLQAFDEFSDALFRHAIYRLSDRERAIELVHDTFTKAWLYVRDGHDIEAFKPFLYKVLNNLIIDEYRKRKESSLDALFEVEGVDESTFGDLVGDDTERIIDALDGQQAVEMLELLPDMYREVIVYRYIDELKPKEIASLIEVSENVVSVRIHRGICMLQELVQREVTRRSTTPS